MRRDVGLAVVAGVWACGVLGAWPLHAGIIADDFVAFSTWQTTPFVQQDNRFTYISSSGISGGILEFVTNVQPGYDLHSITLSQALVNGTFELRYSIEIISGTSRFTAASLGVNVAGSLPNATVTQRVYSDPFVTPAMSDLNVPAGGGSAGPNAISGGLQQIWVEDDIVAAADGQVNSFSNSFVETFDSPTVPEPASVAVLAVMGAAAAVGTWRIRRRWTKAKTPASAIPV